jgi:magnesium and cobalt exporter, CNNM family
LDTDSLPLAVAGTAVSLVLVGFFALSAFVVAGLTRGRYQHLLEEDPERAKPIADLLEGQAEYQLAFGSARTLAVAAAAYCGAVILGWLTEGGQFALVIGLAFALLVASHVLPRAMVAGHSEDVAAGLALPMRIAGALLSPLTWLVVRLVGLRARLGPHGRGGEAEARPTQEELRDIIGERVVEEDELEMIDSIFEMEETTAREIMVPRMDMEALPTTATARQALDAVMAHGYSRLPVFDGTVDNVVGILYAKDLFPVVLAGELGEPVRKFLRPAYFIPESKKVDELLSELQSRRVHIAIVVDEYGGTAGLVTIEDLLEEIVGEIQDEFDFEEDKIVSESEGEATFDATVSIDDVNDTLDLDLEAEGVETIGGLVYERLGKVPVVGDELAVDGARISVVATTGRRIRRVKVVREDAADSPADSAAAR